MPRKRKSIQKSFRNKVFTVSQYWNINYTEKYKNGTEKDFKTFIKAKSFDLAKHFLCTKLKEDDPTVKIKALQGFMIHKNYKCQSKRSLGIEEWDQIRSASFPNVHNVLFKHEVLRPEGYSNRFNSTNYKHLKTIGFKKGSENWSVQNIKGKVMPLDERANKIYIGKWVEWDEGLRDDTKEKLLQSFERHNNNRSLVAKDLGVSRNKVYGLMKKFPEIDWKTDYPAPKQIPPVQRGPEASARAKKTMAKKMAEGFVPFSTMTAEQDSRRRRSIASTFRKQREERLLYWEPKIREALEKCGNSRKESAVLLGVKRSYLDKIMRQLKSKVNWAAEYPTPYSRSQ